MQKADLRIALVGAQNDATVRSLAKVLSTLPEVGVVHLALSCSRTEHQVLNNIIDILTLSRAKRLVAFLPEVSTNSDMSIASVCDSYVAAQDSKWLICPDEAFTVLEMAKWVDGVKLMLRGDEDDTVPKISIARKAFQLLSQGGSDQQFELESAEVLSILKEKSTEAFETTDDFIVIGPYTSLELELPLARKGGEG
jgi:hypothetical protein